MTQVDFETLRQIVAERGRSGRSITAMAGAPGSGKSTHAEKLASELNHACRGSAAVLQMDGFHFDDMVLQPLGLLKVKGAPETFDVGGLRAMLNRLSTNTEDRIAVPVFDRGIEIARAGARIIDRQVRHVIVEGNYLLLRDQPWNSLHHLFHTTVMLDVPEAELRRRLELRWRDLSGHARRLKLEKNDLPNGRIVASRSIDAEFNLKC